MDLLAHLFNPGLRAGTPGPMDNFWYEEAGTQSVTGMKVDADSAQKASGYFRGVTILSNDVAKLPLDVYERLPGGAKQRVRAHPLYEVLHTQPNAWQTSFEWRRQGVRNLINRGNWYNRIVPGPRGPIDQLIPLPPDRVKPVQLKSGRIAYTYREPSTNLVTTFTQDQIFHVRGISDDGVEGKSVLTWARDSIGIALATESYAGRLFSQGTLHSGTITVPGVLDEDASKRMAKSFVTSKDTWHMPKVLEQGATYTESTLTPEDSQFLTSRQFSVTEMSRWLGIPPHKLFDLSRSTNNNIEHQGIEYVGDGLMPWLVLIEQAILRDLILNPARFYAEFNVEGMLRGDSAARGELYKALFGVGAASPNDIARRENYEAADGGDDRYVPQQMRPLSEPYTPAGGQAPVDTPPPPASPAAPPDDSQSDNNASAKAVAITRASAERILRKEISAVERLAKKHAANADAFVEEVAAFYKDHAAFVAQVLVMTPADADGYCAGQAAQIVTGDWVAALTAWKADEYAAQVAALALNQDAPQPPPAQPDPVLEILKARLEQPIQISSPVTIGADAVKVSVAPAAVTVHAPVTIQKGAVAVGAPEVHVSLARTVKRTIERNATGDVTGSVETVVD